MKIIKEKHFTRLIPEEGYCLASQDLSVIFEGEIFLSFLDSPSNYIEISEEYKKRTIEE